MALILKAVYEANQKELQIIRTLTRIEKMQVENPHKDYSRAATAAETQLLELKSLLTQVDLHLEHVLWTKCRAGVDSPTSPTLAGPYFRGALIRWAWQRRTKSDQTDGWSVQLLSRRRFERKYLWEKKLVPQLGIEPLPFACEASALTTEPS